MAPVKQKSSKRNPVLPILLSVLLLLFIGAALLYLYLPIYVESKILPKLSQMARIGNLECDVRRIGFTGLDLGGLYVGDSNETSISIESVRVDYSITGLLSKHINSVVMAGVEFKCEFSNGKFIIPGLDWQSFFSEQTMDKKASMDNLQIPISIGSLKICNAVFVCRYNGKSHRIPFEFLVVAKEGQWDILECTLMAYLGEQKLTLSSRINLPEKKALLKCNFDSIHFDEFENIANYLPCVKISGSIEADCNLQFPQWTIDSSGQFFITLEQSNINKYCYLQVLEPLKTAGAFSAEFTQTGDWGFSLSIDSPSEKPDNLVKDCKIRLDTGDIIFKLPSITVSGEGTESKGKVRYATKLYDFNFTQENVIVKAPSISLIGSANLDRNFMEGMAGFELKISGTDVYSEYLTIFIPELLLGGKTSYLKDGSLCMDVITDFKNVEISNTGYNTKITGISGKIPFQWPCENSERRGDFLIEAIDWDNLKLGTVSGTICQNGLGLVFEGTHNNNLLSGLVLNFKGDTNYSVEEGLKTEFNFNAPRLNINSINLGEFIPGCKGILFSGELELDGNLHVDPEGNVRCTTNTIVHNSNMELKEQGITIEGIDFALSMPDLFSLRSAPNQKFSFGKVSIGKIVFSNVKVGLQIESPETIFIENCEFEWCNGNVFTHAMRVSLYGSDYDFTLYCNRLKLSEVFDQFGIVKAEGGGSVNGRLPVKLEKGLISINNGFLYSTPGQGGTIHITGTDTLDSVIPHDTPQFSQIDFVKEALKNFSYNWVTLSFDTEEDDLNLKMSFDGKSEEPLPFIYNSKLGTFERIDDSKYGINYPIQLDINFQIPVNKILYYGKGVKDVINILK